MTDVQPINISILDKDYKVACPPGEQSALLESAKFLDNKMREIRDSGNIMGSERIAVITALNMANDLLRTSNVDKELGQDLPPRLKDLENKISRVLEQARQLEI
ncbi:MAG: cell division protein ZapA [Gammaproteobacteria bacterium]|nr:cell division protein ZapA [Gammaproteobacteria bacterium]MDH3856818.1 cell division protein ZapA [Gammaproteobacteria bacterium]